MNAQMLTRNVVIANRRTTIRLESAIWDGFDEICLILQASRHELCTHIDQAREGINRAQAVRATVVNFFRLSLKSGISARETFDLSLQS